MSWMIFSMPSTVILVDSMLPFPELSRRLFTYMNYSICLIYTERNTFGIKNVRKLIKDFASHVGLLGNGTYLSKYCKI